MQLASVMSSVEAWMKRETAADFMSLTLRAVKVAVLIFALLLGATMVSVWLVGDRSTLQLEYEGLD